MSLGTVAITAAITSLQHWHKGNLKVTAVFGLFGIFGTYARARQGVITTVQLILFALAV